MNQLQRSLKDYLDYNNEKRDELKVFLNVVDKFGESAIFGGMLRDFLLDSPKQFKGDIDIVVDTNSLDEMFLVFQNYQITKNKMGGLRVSLKDWEIDIWKLSDTWAFKNVNGLLPTIYNLPYTTFFELDSICYNLRTKKILCTPTYFDNFRNKILGVTCPHYPSGSYVLKKAYRYILDMRFEPSPEMKFRLIEAFHNELSSSSFLSPTLIEFYHKFQSHTDDAPLSSFLAHLNKFENSKQLNLVEF